jgi:hypothetical protein
MKSIFSSSSDEEEPEDNPTGTTSEQKRKIVSVYDFMTSQNPTVMGSNIDAHLQNKGAETSKPKKARKTFYDDSSDDESVHSSEKIEHAGLVSGNIVDDSAQDVVQKIPESKSSSMTIGDLLADSMRSPRNTPTKCTGPSHHPSYSRPHISISVADTSVSQASRGRIYQGTSLANDDKDDDIWMDNATPSKPSTADTYATSDKYSKGSGSRQSCISANASVSASAGGRTRSGGVSFTGSVAGAGCVSRSRVEWPSDEEYARSSLTWEEHRPSLKKEPGQPFRSLMLIGTLSSSVKASAASCSSAAAVGRSSGTSSSSSSSATSALASTTILSPTTANASNNTTTFDSTFDQELQGNATTVSPPHPPSEETALPNPPLSADGDCAEAKHAEESASVVVNSSVTPYAAQYLMPYQKEGVQWLWAKYTSGSGCILGDDMGKLLLLTLDLHLNYVTIDLCGLLMYLWYVCDRRPGENCAGECTNWMLFNKTYTYLFNSRMADRRHPLSSLWENRQEDRGRRTEPNPSPGRHRSLFLPQRSPAHRQQRTAMSHNRTRFSR